MAKLLQAVTQFGPKLELQPTAQLDKLSEWMAMRTGLNKSEAMMVFQESSEAILNFCKDGKPVKIPGVGTFTPSLDRNGEVSIGHGFEEWHERCGGLQRRDHQQGPHRLDERGIQGRLGRRTPRRPAGNPRRLGSAAKLSV